MGGGSLAEAERYLTQLFGYANDVGLYAEEIDDKTHEGEGNFPQAYTHIGLVSAALTIEERRRGGEVAPEIPQRKEAPAAEERL